MREPDYRRDGVTVVGGTSRPSAGLEWAVATVIVLGCVAGGLYFRQLARSELRAVHCRWSGSDLYVHTMSGPVEVSHLWYYAGHPVAAPLPEPVLIIDSERRTIDAAALRAMKWRNEGGEAEAPPRAGTKVFPLVRRLEMGTAR